ncbi:MAG: hypothetical protein RMY28_020580 [Nostoc sp. ChiSLP01]|nr:hypothetical protein [Nostoc sp. ChiSLP01]
MSLLAVLAISSETAKWRTRRALMLQATGLLQRSLCFNTQIIPKHLSQV